VPHPLCGLLLCRPWRPALSWRPFGLAGKFAATENAPDNPRPGLVRTPPVIRRRPSLVKPWQQTTRGLAGVAAALLWFVFLFWLASGPEPTHVAP